MTGIRVSVGRAPAIISALAILACPAFAADIGNGEQLARHMCSGCHLVAGNQRQANADVPPFSTIANMPNFSAEKVAFFLLDPHPRMPDFSLTRRQVDDIAGYIGSLAK